MASSLCGHQDRRGPHQRQTVAGRRPRAGLLGAARELALIAGLFGLYQLGRRLARGEPALALANGHTVHRLEGLLHLPSEAVVQAWTGSAAVFRAANLYYVSLHFPLMVLFLTWGYLRRSRAEYRWARNLLIVQTGVALAIHIVFPLAPPRMFPGWGFVDTMTTVGPSAYGGAGASVANQFAAMPSLHVGWAVLIAYVVARTGPRLLAGLAGLHAAVTAAVVIITANHWWLDGIVAIVILALAATVCRPPQDALTGPVQEPAGTLPS